MCICELLGLTWFCSRVSSDMWFNSFYMHLTFDNNKYTDSRQNNPPQK